MRNKQNIILMMKCQIMNWIIEKLKKLINAPDTKFNGQQKMNNFQVILCGSQETELEKRKGA